MRQPRLPPASWLLLLAASATQCPDTDETLDLRVVLSDAQGFRRNDVRWSLSAASSMDAYTAGALVGGGNATLDAGAGTRAADALRGAGQLLARVPAAARRVRRGHRAAGLRDADARADGYTDVGAHAPPDDVQDAHDGLADLGAHGRERVARAVHPAEPAADAPALVQAHGGAHSRSRRATRHRWRHPAHRRRSPQRRRRPPRRLSRRQRPRRCRRRGRRLNRRLNRRRARRRSLRSVRPACPCPCPHQYRRPCRRRHPCRRRRPSRRRTRPAYPPRSPRRDRRRARRPRYRPPGRRRPCRRALRRKCHRHSPYPRPRPSRRRHRRSRRPRRGRAPASTTSKQRRTCSSPRQPWTSPST